MGGDETYRWELLKASDREDNKLLYGPPESEADFALSCAPRSGLVQITATAENPRRSIRLFSGKVAVLTTTSAEYDGEVFEGYTLTAQLPAAHRLFSAFAASGDLRTDTALNMPARTADEIALVVSFVRRCRKPSYR